MKRKNQAQVVQTWDSAIQRINHHPADKYFEETYCAIKWIENLSSGWLIIHDNLYLFQNMIQTTQEIKISLVQFITVTLHRVR